VGQRVARLEGERELALGRRGVAQPQRRHIAPLLITYIIISH
jgi:hypothetical protein